LNAYRERNVSRRVGQRDILPYLKVTLLQNSLCGEKSGLISAWDWGKLGLSPPVYPSETDKKKIGVTTLIKNI